MVKLHKNPLNPHELPELHGHFRPAQRHLQRLGGVHRRQPQAALAEVSAGGFGGAAQAAQDLKTFQAREVTMNFRLRIPAEFQLWPEKNGER